MILRIGIKYIILNYRRISSFAINMNIYTIYTFIKNIVHHRYWRFTRIPTPSIYI